MNAAVLLINNHGILERIRSAKVTMPCARFDASPNEHSIRFNFPGNGESTYVNVSVDDRLANEYEPGEIPEGVREFVLVDYHTADAFRQFAIDCLKDVDCFVDDDRSERLWECRELRDRIIADRTWDWRDDI